MKVVIYEPSPRDFFWFHTNVKTPHLGPPILARLAKERGHEALVVSELIGPLDYSYLDGADVVGVSINTGLTHQRAYEIVREIRHRRPDVPIVGGGHHATLNVGEALEHVDFVIRGYAEVSFPELIEELHAGERRPRAPGVSYLDPESGLRVDNPTHGATPIGTPPDLGAIVGYKRLIDDKRWHVSSYGNFLPLSFFSRGCGFKCHFCSIPLADDPRMAHRTVEEVAEDVRYQIDFYDFPYLKPKVWLIDDNFGQHRKQTREFLEGLAEARLPCNFVVQARVEIGNDAELLAEMRQAGFKSIYVGIESFSDDNLKTMNKSSNLQKIEKAVRAIQAAGMSVVALLMFGNDGDRPGVARSTLRYLNELKIRHINPQITVPYPGTELHRQIEQEGRIFSNAFYDCNKRPIYFPRTIRPSQVVREIRGITKMHLSRRRVYKNLLRHHDFQNLVTRFGVVSSGFLDRVLEETRELEAVESEYYDSEHYLKEEHLRAHRESGLFLERLRELVPAESLPPESTPEKRLPPVARAGRSVPSAGSGLAQLASA